MTKKNRKQRKKVLSSLNSLQAFSDKRSAVEEVLARDGFVVNANEEHGDFVVRAREFVGLSTRKIPRTPNQLHASLGQVCRARDIEIPKSSRKTKQQRKYLGDFHEFYESYAWRKIRYEVLKRSNGYCMCCGASPRNRPGTVLNVDHIKPLRTHWELRLDPGNLQVLCNACNHGKGNRDQTDWRPPLNSETATEVRPRRRRARLDPEDLVEVTVCPPGVAEGAESSQNWALHRRRARARSGPTSQRYGASKHYLS